MKKCPICETELENPIPDFCEACGWELRNDLTLVPSIDMPESAIEDYRTRAEIARRNWMKVAETVRRNQELEKWLRELEAATGSTARDRSVEMKKWESSRIEDANHDKRTQKVYSEQTTFPDLTRDPFETIEEFDERINNHPPIPAGKAELIKRGYDIETGRFPVKISWDMKPGMIEGMPSDQDGAFIVAERDTARAFYESRPQSPVFVILNAAKETVKIHRIALAWEGREFEVCGYGPENFEKRSEPQAAVWVEPTTGMEFVYVPGGSFEMGDVFGVGSDEEKPVHEVRLEPFFIGKFPVTQGQWKKVTGENPSRFRKGEDYPVEKVSWNDAKDFICKLSNANGGKYGLCLPSEAQWEYAARSGGKQERYAGGDVIDTVAWYKGNSKGATHPVGTKKANGLGIYDMSGNVWEWCEDLYSEQAYQTHQKTNPICTIGEAKRVFRGGGWGDGPSAVRCAFRDRDFPDYRIHDLGFRLVRTI